MISQLIMISKGGLPYLMGYPSRKKGSIPETVDFTRKPVETNYRRTIYTSPSLEKKGSIPERVDYTRKPRKIKYDLTIYNPYPLRNKINERQLRGGNHALS